jgi:hypothetical protein
MTTTLAAPDVHHQTRTSAVRGEASLDDRFQAVTGVTGVDDVT